MKFKKFVASAVCAAFMLPTLAFGATLNVNLKDSIGGSFTDLSGITVTVLDGVGAVVSNITPSTPQVVIPDLLSGESYSVIAKYNKSMAVAQNGNVIVSTTTKKSANFLTDDEVLSKDMYIQNPTASNILLRVTSIPAEWTGTNVHLTPIERSNFQVDKEKLSFALTPSAGVAEMTVVVPNGKYSWAVANQDNSVNHEGAQRTLRTDTTLSMNISSTISPILTTVFELKNPDRSAVNFAGETIFYEIKNDANAVVHSNTIIASGASINDVTPALANGKYTVYTKMTNGGTISRESTKTVNLYGAPKTNTVKLIAMVSNNIEFKLKDARTNQDLNNVTMVIKDNKDNVLETLTVNGSLSKALLSGYAYKIELSATGYNQRILNLYPRNDGVREVSLSKI